MSGESEERVNALIRADMPGARGALENPFGWSDVIRDALAEIVKLRDAGPACPAG